MTYDFHGSWENFLGHNAPLKGRDGEDDKQATLNIDYVIDYWISNGAPREKLMLGMATYGRTFRLEKASKTKAGNTAVGPGTAGKVF